MRGLSEAVADALGKVVKRATPPGETEVAYRARRAELLTKVDLGELAWSDVTQEIAWYLPTDVLDRLFKADIEGQPKPRVQRFDVPIDPDAADMVNRGTLETTKALARVKAWWGQRHDRGAVFVLVLVGGTGVGKTVAAAWALRESGSTDSSYVKAAHLASIHRVAFSDSRREWEDLVRRSPLLVIDELGAGERNDDRARAAIHDAIDERQGRPTLVISNVDGSEIGDYLDARTLDRLRGRGTLAACSGPSMRGRSIADVLGGHP